MGSKLILGLFLLAMVLLISYEVGARELEETPNAVGTSTNEKTNGAEVNHYGGGYGGGGRGGYGGGRGGGYGGRRGGYCRYGCCGRSYYRRSCRCCNYAGEKVVAAPQVKPHK